MHIQIVPVENLPVTKDPLPGVPRKDVSQACLEPHKCSTDDRRDLS